jgi:hypothetical protein
MPHPEELKMDVSERLWWERVRARGALWYVVTKGVFFLVAFPGLGCQVLGWQWTPSLLVEGWLLGLFCGSFLFLRKDLRYRFTMDYEGLPMPESGDE